MLGENDVTDRAGFLRVVAQVRRELAAGAPIFENDTLPAFMEAMEAWATDWPGEFENPWALASALVQAAAIYE